MARVARAAELAAAAAGVDLADDAPPLQLRPLRLQRRHFGVDRLRIPIVGRAESLNLASAAAVCLYASARAQRRAARPA